MSDLTAEVQRRVDAIPRGELSPFSSDAILLVRNHLPRLVAALDEVADAARRAYERGSFDICDNEPECRDESEPMKESQWCTNCRAEHEIATSLAALDAVRGSLGM